jgi:hypothetical protein
MALPIPELEQIIMREEHLVQSLKNVLSLASDHCEQIYPKDTPYVTADGIIARESIARIEAIMKRFPS